MLCDCFLDQCNMACIGPVGPITPIFNELAHFIVCSAMVNRNITLAKFISNTSGLLVVKPASGYVFTCSKAMFTDRSRRNAASIQRRHNLLLSGISCSTVSRRPRALTIDQVMRRLWEMQRNINAYSP